MFTRARARSTLATLALALAVSVTARRVHATTSPQGVASPMGGNGHNITFDGRLFVVTTGAGWVARILRPERVTMAAGFADVSAAFSSPLLVQPTMNNENALALCETDAARTPFACDAAGAPAAAGPFACYDLYVIDSDALAMPASNFILRRRRLFVWVSAPRTAAATVARFEWRETLRPLTPTLRGIEPTVSRDGRLLVWQGHPANDGRIDNLMYSYNASPCATAGWSAPRNLSAMYLDPNAAVRSYRLAERQLRASTGDLFPATQVFPGAYPWLFPDGDAVSFTAVNMPCRTTTPEDPPGCGPRRNAFSVIGYPTNWGVAHVDGAINPDTDNTVRLFFSSPGPMNARPLPVTMGRDVWPFFGSNTSNYTELVFDDGLDGNYGGIWHFNEAVALNGTYDRARTPDTSGFFNTGNLIGGASFPLRNNGHLGKAIDFNGTSARVEVPNAASLNPVNNLTVELRVRPAVDPNCDAGNNYRWLLRKGTGYSLVLEDDRQLHARVGVGAREYEVWSGMPIPVGAWSRIAFTYEGATGQLALWLNGMMVNRSMNPPGTLTASAEALRIGGLGTTPACPTMGGGSFQGAIDEVAVSRIVRFGATMPPLDAGVVMDAGGGPDSATDVPARTDMATAPDTVTAPDVVTMDSASVDDAATMADSAGSDAGTGTDGVATADSGRDGGGGTMTPSGCACRAVGTQATHGSGGMFKWGLGCLVIVLSVSRRRRLGAASPRRAERFAARDVVVFVALEQHAVGIDETFEQAACGHGRGA